MHISHELQQLETRLTLGQALVYRTFVALQHSRALREQPEVRQQWLGIMDVLSVFVDALPTMDEDETTSPATAQRTGGVSFRLECPRLGIKLINRSPATGVGGVAAMAMAAAAAAGSSRVDGGGAPPPPPRPRAEVVALLLQGLNINIPDVYHLRCAGHVPPIHPPEP